MIQMVRKNNKSVMRCSNCGWTGFGFPDNSMSVAVASVLSIAAIMVYGCHFIGIKHTKFKLMNAR